jgi:SOS-response transcriptional repressor LexA
MKDTNETRRSNLRLLIDESGGNGAFARITGKSPSQLSQWLSGNRNLSHEAARGLEQSVGKPPGWLDTPRNESASAMCSNVDAPLRPVGAVPLISWVRAGNPMPAVEGLEPGDGIEWVPCPDRHSPTTFALRVVGDSMVASTPGAYSYPEGSIIFCDPAQPAHIGSHVIASVDGEVTFKVMHRRGERYLLRPLNPVYDEIEMTEGDSILAVVIGSYRGRAI